MSNNLVKRIIGVGSALLTLIFTLLIKVNITLTDGKNTSSPISKSFFKFIEDAKKMELYSFARIMMLVGFILVVVCTLYFIGILIFSLLKKEKILNKMHLITMIIGIVLVVAMFAILIAGFDKEEIGLTGLTNNITLFGVPWMIGLVFSLCPIASEYLIKE